MLPLPLMVMAIMVVLQQALQPTIVLIVVVEELLI
jgi:hypothetical protein